MSKAGLWTSMMPVLDVLDGILHIERGVRARANSSHLEKASTVSNSSVIIALKRQQTYLSRSRLKLAL
jgi:hypothetical protein